MSPHQSLLLTVSSGVLVFGLEWFPLLGEQARRQSRRLASKYGASHKVLASELSGSVGLVSLRLKRAERGKHMYSAAQNLARLFPQGTVALILALPDQQWWLAAVHQGAVIARTDRLYPSLCEAQTALDALRPAYPQLSCLDGEAVAAPSLSQLYAGTDDSCALYKTARWHNVLPLPVQWFVFLLVLVLLLPRLWDSINWTGNTSKVAEKTLELPPEQAWQQAINQAVRGRVLHGLTGTRILLDALYELPVVLAGWHLTQVECGAGVAPSWNCRAHYRRHVATASNDGFLSQAPAAWTTQFPGIDSVQVDWNVAVSGVALAWQVLKTTADIDRYWLSDLQAIRSAFNQIELGQPVALPVQQPHDQQGQLVPRPAGLPLYLLRHVQISGPLRSFMLLLPYTATVGWSRVVLSISNTAQSTLKNSQLSVAFQGVHYEITSLP